jgi:type II secretory pathway component GspD/PulD (secretin)
MDIPWLGALFRRDSMTKVREELIVLIEPTVMLSPGRSTAFPRRCSKASASACPQKPCLWRLKITENKNAPRAYPIHMRSESTRR